MAISRRGLFNLAPAMAAVPAAAVIGTPRDLVISAPGTTVENCQFSGGIRIASTAHHVAITHNRFDMMPGISMVRVVED
jgi:hypothetical protein